MWPTSCNLSPQDIIPNWSVYCSFIKKLKRRKKIDVKQRRRIVIKRNLITALIMNLFSLFFVVGSTEAIMIIEKPFNQVAQEAELIFEGKVLSTETRLHPINDTCFFWD